MTSLLQLQLKLKLKLARFINKQKMSNDSELKDHSTKKTRIQRRFLIGIGIIICTLFLIFIYKQFLSSNGDDSTSSLQLPKELGNRFSPNTGKDEQDHPSHILTQPIQNQEHHIKLANQLQNLMSNNININNHGDIQNKNNNNHNNNIKKLNPSYDITKIGGADKYSGLIEGRMVLLVTYRDTFMGCGNYEEYIFDNIETLFCLPNGYIEDVGLDKLVKKYPNAHLLPSEEHNQFRGEMWCRKQGVDYINNGNLNFIKIEDIDYYASWNCEMLSFHNNELIGLYGIPLYNGLNKLIWTFETERIRRRNNITYPRPQDPIPNDRDLLDLFAIAPSHWEGWADPYQLGNLTNLNRTKFDRMFYHALDWVWNETALINKLGYNGEEKQWVSDHLFFAETHAIIYDWKLLNKYYNGYFMPGLDTWINEDPGLGLFLKPYNLTAIRDNSVNLRVNFAIYEEQHTDFTKENNNLILKWHWKLQC